MVKNKILLLDMYGVIIKESKGYFIPYTYQNFAESEYDRLTKALKEDKYFTRAQSGELTSNEFLAYLGYAEPEETMKDYLQNYLTLDEQFPPFAAEYSKTMDFCLLSNDVLEWSEFLTGYHQLNRYFTEKIVSGEVRMRKPDRQIFLATLERLKCEAGDCIFVDNSVKNLRVAKDIGMQTILFNRDNEEYDGRVVNDFRKLGSMLENM